MRLLFILAIWAASLSALAEEKSPYLSLAGDVPLAPGLVEEDERAVIFDKPQGRIIRMVARLENSGDIPAISQFYRLALPNLGWKSDRQNLSFTRDGEQLSIAFNATDNATLAIVEIRPH